MAPEDIKALRKELGCTARELATALGIEQEEVLAWERGDLFPTKQWVSKMETLRAKGPQAIPRKKKTQRGQTPMVALANADVWRLFRKLLVHPEFRASVAELAES